ncbi:hypothetical protein BFW87_16910 [Pseudomonas fluorescens]|uniref:Uncharacterized protein n=1 Tax=Pseudomonas fluorescens TaxID=294 RepID=A0A1T2YLM5_PSEFL|nr:hypothetical protein BFW87_16910 [Pseudomonas fluorescens]
MGAGLLWRGSLLPLGCAAAPKNRSAAHSSGSKLPRHNQPAPTFKRVVLRMCDNAHHFEPTPESS